MATYYVDKYATGAADGSSWQDAWTTINAGAWAGGDTMFIKGYGPDDPYTAVTAGYGMYISAGDEGTIFHGDNGTGSADAPVPRMAYVEPGANYGIGPRSCTLDHIAFVGCTTAVIFSTAVSAGNNIRHCRAIACTTRGIGISGGGNAIIEWHESYNNVNGESLNLAGVSFNMSHCTYYGNGTGSEVVGGSSVSAGSISMRSCIVVNGSANIVWLDNLAQWATGQPDYNHTDRATAADTYNPDLSAAPAHDAYGITIANYLPFAAYGILSPTRGFPGEGAGHDGMDVGAGFGQYAIECYPRYSCEVNDTGATRNEDPASLRVGTDTQEWRIGVTYSIRNVPAGAVVDEAWATLYVNTLSSGAAVIDIHPYAGQGHNRDPETDGDGALATLYAYLDDGPVLANDLDYGASTSATGQYAAWLNPTHVNPLIDEARAKDRDEISLGLRLDDETVAHCHVDGTGSATEARKPRLILVYHQPPTTEMKLRAARNMLAAALGSVR